ncbi:MAG TPA: prolyl oligopeptidase family serine peptidase [Gaiellaceae bacterium]|nr:prolyl oligopeptidase family serine peptidase [Gaiellaceae bacterium]
MAASGPAGLTARRIESLLSARLFLEPQLRDGRLFFLSNLSGHLSLYAMDAGGGVPEPLLPPRLALQNPELVGGRPFHVLPALGLVLVMIDRDGDENYEPFTVPLEGGFPEPFAPAAFRGRRSYLLDVDEAAGVAYVAADSRQEPMRYGLRVDLASRSVEMLGQSPYGAYPAAWTPDHARVVLADAYTMGDVVLYEAGPDGGRRPLAGTLLEEREPGRDEPLTGFRSPHGTASGEGVLLVTALHDDSGAPGYLPLAGGEVEPVAVEGLRHAGEGELEALRHLEGDRYALLYNIDGCAWAYEAELDEPGRRLRARRLLVGEGELAAGTLHGLDYERGSGRFALSFCGATEPTQLYVLEPDGEGGTRRTRLTRERVLGVPRALLAEGEDASFTSHDGLRVSARLYLPSPELGFEGPRPLVYYVHGGPQSQERPNFAWFSMPLIQILTLEGFAVFVPNVRGSTGYGLAYAKRVDRDWGGADRLDHVHAMTEVLPRDGRVDVSRAGVVGRSYGGYMALLLAGRHPDLWRAAVDMFGPYDLLTFLERIPPTWKPYFALAVGDPERDRDLLVERSPRTYVRDIACPLLVIQGRNDPRVVEQESRDLVEELRALGKQVEYLVFEDEGHDVLKLGNRVRCYEAITRFFRERLAAV